MKIENLLTYEINKRADAIKQKPNSNAVRLADAALELINNEAFTSNPKQFLANPIHFNTLSPFHKSVITAVYGISFRHCIK